MHMCGFRKRIDSKTIIEFLCFEIFNNFYNARRLVRPSVISFSFRYAVDSLLLGEETCSFPRIPHMDKIVKGRRG